MSNLPSSEEILIEYLKLFVIFPELTEVFVVWVSYSNPPYTVKGDIQCGHQTKQNKRQISDILHRCSTHKCLKLSTIMRSRLLKDNHYFNPINVSTYLDEVKLYEILNYYRFHTNPYLTITFTDHRSHKIDFCHQIRLDTTNVERAILEIEKTLLPS